MSRFCLLLCLLFPACNPQAVQHVAQAKTESIQASTPEAPPGLMGMVVAVHDGDTCKVLLDGKQTTIRLEGIDAPELGQPFGKNAKEALSSMIFGKMVTVKVTGKDRYKRTIGTINDGPLDVNLAMVQRGMAWRFVQYSKEAALIEAEKGAREAKRGLWAAPDAMAPWEWRKVKSAK